MSATVNNDGQHLKSKITLADKTQNLRTPDRRKPSTKTRNHPSGRSGNRAARVGRVSATSSQKSSEGVFVQSQNITPQRLVLDITDGTVLIGSDLHAWPSERLSTAFRAFVHFAKVMEPAAISLNGDLIDGASISRWPRIMWQAQPTVKQELEAAQEHLHQLTLAAPRHCELFAAIGNHDARFDAKLAASCPEFENVRGFRLCDHFSDRWQWSWSVWINDSVVVKHRFKGGVHATHNNTVNSGRTTVTGHLHSLKVTPFSDYSGMRWGVDTGTLSDPNGAHAAYAEGNPLNHRSGFIVLTFNGGRLMWPEIVSVIDDNHVDFRGEIIEV
jgi:hypothetical protein